MRTCSVVVDGRVRYQKQLSRQRWGILRPVTFPLRVLFRVGPRKILQNVIGWEENREREIVRRFGM